MIKKFLGMFINGVAMIFGIAMFLIALAPAVTQTITLPIVGTSVSHLSFYELFQFVGMEEYAGFSALVIIIVICLCLGIIFCSISSSISLFLRKKMANVAAFTAFIGSLNFLISGILMFFIVVVLGNRASTLTLGTGAICNGIIGILVAGTAFLAGLVDLKKIK
jgi:hypothetical protein